jgi:ABC-type multidrug transport system ATPase subunit
MLKKNLDSVRLLKVWDYAKLSSALTQVMRPKNNHGCVKNSLRRVTNVEHFFNYVSVWTDKLCPWAVQIDIPGVNDPRILLNYVSGYAKPGTMTALMGSSGAGKTTLLDVLAGRKTTGRIRGDILINGHPKVQETFARVMG